MALSIMCSPPPRGRRRVESRSQHNTTPLTARSPRGSRAAAATQREQFLALMEVEGGHTQISPHFIPYSNQQLLYIIHFNVTKGKPCPLFINYLNHGSINTCTLSTSQIEAIPQFLICSPSSTKDKAVKAQWKHITGMEQRNSTKSKGKKEKKE